MKQSDTVTNLSRGGIGHRIAFLCRLFRTESVGLYNQEVGLIPEAGRVSDFQNLHAVGGLYDLVRVFGLVCHHLGFLGPEIDGTQRTLVAGGEIALVEVGGHHLGFSQETRLHEVVGFEFLAGTDGVIADVHLVVKFGGAAFGLLAGGVLLHGHGLERIGLLSQVGDRAVQALDFDIGVGQLVTQAVDGLLLVGDLRLQVVDGLLESGIVLVAGCELGLELFETLRITSRESWLARATCRESAVVGAPALFPSLFPQEAKVVRATAAMMAKFLIFIIAKTYLFFIRIP